MKKKTKGILAFAFLGGIMVTSGVTIAIPGIMPEEESDITLTGTPADNFPDAQRAQFCGSSIAKSTDYVQEYSIPTLCTNPLAIVTDYDGNVWFTQTNTGKLAKFSPSTETFTEYDNLSWPPGARSMMWGIDYAPDGSVWYTDEAFDSIWKFSTIDEKYERLGYPTEGDALPQKLKIDGSQIIVNDFTGNKLTLLDPNQSGDVNYLSIPSPVDDSVTPSGAVEVAVGRQRIRLGRGDFFGELALLGRHRRQADVTALGYCRLLVLLEDDLKALLATDAELAARIDEVARRRMAMNREVRSEAL